jgi:hypothetical protein
LQQRKLKLTNLPLDQLPIALLQQQGHSVYIAVVCGAVKGVEVVPIGGVFVGPRFDQALDGGCVA